MLRGLAGSRRLETSLVHGLQACGVRHDPAKRNHRQHAGRGDSNRQAPGTGHIDFFDVIRTLNTLNYDGYFAVDSVPIKPDWKTLIKDSIGFMKQVERTVELQEQLDNEMRVKTAAAT